MDSTTHVLGQLGHLLGSQSSVGEHANLRCDVAPVVLAAKLLEVLLEESTHGDDAVGHALDLTEPLLVERRVVQDLRGNAGAMDRRVRVQWADKDLDLRVDALLLLGRLADDGEGTNTLSVETLAWSVSSSRFVCRTASHHVLCEGLSKARAETLLDEVAESKGILVGVTRSKALVGHVEEGVVLAFLDSLSNLQPLFLSRINTSRVVGAGVEQDDAVLGHGLDVGDHAIEVEANGVLVVVPVLFDLEARVLEDSGVVRPRWGRDVDGFCVRVVTLEEGAADAEGTGTGDGLGDGDAVLSERSRVLSVSKLESSLGELGDTGDAGVLLVEVGVDDLLFGLLHRREDVGLTLVVAIGANTCVRQWCNGRQLMLWTDQG